MIWNVKSRAPAKETLPCQIEEAEEDEEEEGEEGGSQSTASQLSGSGSQLSGEIYHVDGRVHPPTKGEPGAPVGRRVAMPGDEW